MVNRILGSALAASMAFPPAVSQAQEDVRRGIICTLPSYCSLEDSSLVYTLNPGIDRAGTARDVDGYAELNINCVTDNGTRFTGHIHQILQHGWGSHPMSTLNGGTLYPYVLEHGENGDDSFNCEMGRINIGTNNE